MAGATTRKRLFGPALLTSATATKYTAPALTLTAVNQIRVSNGSTAAATLTISIGADAAGTRINDAESIPANSVKDYYFSPGLILATAELIAAFSGTTGVLTLTMFGSETVLG